MQTEVQADSFVFWRNGTGTRAAVSPQTVRLMDGACTLRGFEIVGACQSPAHAFDRRYYQ